MLHLFKAFARRFQFTFRSLLCFLDESVQYNDTLTLHETVKCPANSGFASRAELKQAFTEGFAMWQAEIDAMLDQKFDNAGVVSEYVNRPGLDFGQDTLVEVFNLKRHVAMLANTLTRCKRPRDSFGSAIYGRFSPFTAQPVKIGND
jgi:hypothetical protein